MRQPPNILLVICHDMGRQLACYGRPTHSPAIDQLASEGVRFDRYFAAAPQCSPSRAALISGRWPHRTGVLGLAGQWGWRMGAEVPTIPQVLTAAGYDTWLWGFQHEHDDPAALGYRHDPIGFKGNVPTITADYVIPRLCDWLSSRPKGPWFCSVGVYETHLGWPRRPCTAAERAAKPVPPYLPQLPELQQDMMDFDASLGHVDWQIQRLMETLQSTGLDEDTLVIFTTDHGLPLPRAKCDLRDAGLEAALIMRWPGRLSGNRVCSELLSGVDLMPTLLDLAGVGAPDEIDGRSFGGLLLGGHYQPRTHLFAEQTWHDMYRPLRAVRTDRYKLIRRFNDFPENALPKDFYSTAAAAAPVRDLLDQVTPARTEFYDLAADPCELRPQTDAGGQGLPPEGQRLQALLHDWMEQTQDPLLRGPVACPDGTSPT